MTPDGAVVKKTNKQKKPCLPMQEALETSFGWIRGLGRYPGAGNSNLLQCSCLYNPMDRGAWWATIHGVAKSQIRLSVFPSLPL